MTCLHLSFASIDRIGVVRARLGDLPLAVFQAPEEAAFVAFVAHAGAQRFHLHQNGVQVGTTSYDAITNVIKPTTETAVFDTNDAAVQALKNKQVDAIVVDLPTAAYLTNVEIDDSTIIGQLDAGQPEHFSAVLAKGSALTPCVNAAIKALDADATFRSLVTKYLDFAATPVIAP